MARRQMLAAVVPRGPRPVPLLSSWHAELCFAGAQGVCGLRSTGCLEQLAMLYLVTVQLICFVIAACLAQNWHAQQREARALYQLSRD
mmetsp:Transcript_112824/g.329736  ORF Transcript_112824/g.329736 Transcript_112824/m.329736 type:complete len:88 (-) Transcript_112824:2706-2969(-)